MNKYKRGLAHGKNPVLIGNPDFKKETIHGLVPGTKVSQIGKTTGERGGKNSSSCRHTEFNPPVEYAGTISIDNHFYAGFKLPEKHKGQDIYLLFATGHDFPELLLQDIPGQSILIHKAVFKTVETA